MGVPVMRSSAVALVGACVLGLCLLFLSEPAEATRKSHRATRRTGYLDYSYVDYTYDSRRRYYYVDYTDYDYSYSYYDDDFSLAGGVIAGIVIGIVFGIVLLVAICIACCKAACGQNR